MRLKAKIIILFCAITMGNVIACPALNLDSLQQVIEKTKADSSKLRLMHIFYKEIVRIEPKTAHKIAKKGLFLARNYKVDGIRSKVYMAKWYNNIGGAEFYLGNLEKCKESFQFAYSLAADQKDSVELARAMINTASVFLTQDQYDISLDMLNEALEINDSSKSPINHARCYTVLGITFDQLGNLEKSLEFHNKALEISKKTNRLNGIATALNNIGVILRQHEKFEESNNHLQEAAAINKKLNDAYAMVHNYQNIGNNYTDLGNFGAALEYYSLAMKNIPQPPNPVQISQVYLNMGKLYAVTNNPTKAIEFTRKALVEAKKANAQTSILNAYRNLMASFVDLNIPDSVGYYFVQFTNLNKEIYSKETQGQIAMFEAKFKTKEKENEIKRLLLEKQVKEVELKNEATLRNAFVSGFAIILIALLVIVYTYRQKIRTTKKLAEKEKLMNSQTAKLQGQEAERSRIAKDLHDGLGGTLASIRLQLIDSNNQKGENLKHSIDAISKACAEVRALSHNLASPHLENTTLTQALYDYKDNINTFSNTDFGFESGLNEQKIPLTLELKTEVYRIIQELCNNIIKHSKAPEAEIDINTTPTNLTILVADTGIGFDTSIKKAGIGLANIKSRVKALNGEIKIESIQNTGTTVGITIPLA